MHICKHCGTELEIKQTKQKASQRKQPYYYTAYYQCPKCGRLYHDEKFKVTNQNLFDEKEGKNESDSPIQDVDVEIWTDGACTNNGNERAKAAWAFVSGKYEESGLVPGKQTNNRAEALAILHALEWAVDKKFRHIRIHTDSQISIHGVQKSPKMVKVNQEIFQQIADVIAKNNLMVEYQKVLGHSGDENNERADKLANGLVS